MKRIAKWLIVLAWLGVMMALSRQTGDASMRLSTPISQAFVKLLSRFGMQITVLECDLLIRKVAHFFVYFVAAMLLYGALMENNSRVIWHGPLLTLSICIVIAILDEYQKTFIPGRHCNWSEAAINCAGALAGTILRLFLFKHRMK